MTMTLGMNLRFHSLDKVIVTLARVGSCYGITCLMFLIHLMISAHLGKNYLTCT